MPSESHPPGIELHALIGRLIDEGRLPVLLPDIVSAGYGCGSRCDGCDQPVTHTQIEYEVGDRRDGTSQLSLHLECYVLWQIECVKRMKKRKRGARLN
jgi:hypothetical protein